MQKPSQMVTDESKKEKYQYEHLLGHCCSELLFPFQFFPCISETNQEHSCI